MKAVLVMFKADGKRREFPLKLGTHVIGRQKTCKLRIPLPSVSRRHAELVVTEDGVTVRDLGSSNGTFRNGSRVEEAVLEPGDELRVGPLDLILADGEDADAVKPPSAAAGLAAASAGDSGSVAFNLDAEEGTGTGLSDSVSSPNPLDVSSPESSASASGSSMMAIDLDGDDDEAADSDDSQNTTAEKPAASRAASAADDDDDEDLDDLLANFGKDDAGGSSEFDFLADVEVLDDDKA